MVLPSLVTIVTCLLLLVESKKDKFLYCSVCRALVDEIEWNISQVDPRKTVEVGTFRVDSHGNQARSEIPLAQSEAYLQDVMETICSKTSEYGKTTDTKGRTTVIRTRRKDGLLLSDKNVIDSDTDFNKRIKLYCDSLVEDYEEEMISLLRKDNKSNLPQSICQDLTDVCSSEDLEEPLPVAEERKEGGHGGDQNTQDDEHLLETDREEL